MTTVTWYAVLHVVVDIQRPSGVITDLMTLTRGVVWLVLFGMCSCTCFVDIAVVCVLLALFVVRLFSRYDRNVVEEVVTLLYRTDQ